MEKVVLSGYVLVPDSELDIVMEELPIHIKNTLAEKGCLIFEVSRDDLNKNKLNVYEEFTDKTAFECHQERVRNSKWGYITRSCERNYEIRGL